jgi:Zn-dependent protease with chaperone function
LKIMDASELKFVIGHEMGHVDLGHTWLNTILGGLAGMPPSQGAAVLLQVAFRWWNRSCEYSADRAGMIACGSLQKATSALVKLVAHNARTPQQIERALQVIDEEDENFGNVLAETLATHPMIIHRIEKLREFAKTDLFKRWVEAH